jgi:hypothetical protein
MKANVSIMGKPTVAQEQAEKFIKDRAPKAPAGIVRAFYLLGELEGVRPDIALAQSIHETGWFNFGGDVKPDQNNYAGIGAVGGGAAGATFPSMEYGILAQLHHLKAYATKEEPKLLNHSPRAHFVTKGISPTVAGLSGRWAVPGYDTNKYGSLGQAKDHGDTYSHKIMDLVERMEQVEVGNGPMEPNNPPDELKPESYVTEARLKEVADSLAETLYSTIKEVSSNRTAINKNAETTMERLDRLEKEKVEKENYETTLKMLAEVLKEGLE